MVNNKPNHVIVNLTLTLTLTQTTTLTHSPQSLTLSWHVYPIPQHTMH